MADHDRPAPDTYEPPRLGLDPPPGLTELAGIVLGPQHSREAVLTRVTDIANRVIPGAADVSVTVIRDGKPATIASSSQFALDADEAQYAFDSGPCLDALRHGQIVLVDDLSTDERWPAYGSRARDAGVRGSLSVPLPVEDRNFGAFNCYARSPHSFTPEARRVAEQLAAYAGVVLNNADLYFTAASRADNLARALESRAVVEQAKGILMARLHCTAHEAFDILAGQSQKSHRRLRDIAAELVETTAQG